MTNESESVTNRYIHTKIQKLIYWSTMQCQLDYKVFMYYKLPAVMTPVRETAFASMDPLSSL